MLHKKTLLNAVLCIVSVIFFMQARINTTYVLHIHGFQGNVVQMTPPKCGTHLLRKFITEVTGRVMKFWKSNSSMPSWKILSHISLEDADILSSSGPRYLWLTHTVYSDELYAILQKNNCKIIFLYRDPRDQIVSSAYFLKKRNPEVLASISIHDLISRLILEGPPLPDENIVPGIANMYYRRMQWKACPEICSLRFEDLVSNDIEVRLVALRKLTRYLEVSLSDDELLQAFAAVYGKGVTFRKGTVGGWKQHFTEEHKRLIKQEIGPLLVELGYEENDEW